MCAETNETNQQTSTPGNIRFDRECEIKRNGWHSNRQPSTLLSSHLQPASFSTEPRPTSQALWTQPNAADLRALSEADHLVPGARVWLMHHHRLGHPFHPLFPVLLAASGHGHLQRRPPHVPLLQCPARYLQNHLKGLFIRILLPSKKNMADKGYSQTAVPVMQQTPVIVPQIMFGPDPMQVTCGQCHKTVMTTTVTENGACAWIAALVVCLICCPCFWIPLVMDSCKDVNHTCPACGAMLGRYKKM